LDLGMTNIYGQIGAILCCYLDQEIIPNNVLEDELDDFGDGQEKLTKIEVKQRQKQYNSEAREARKRLGKLISLIYDIVHEDYSKLDEDDLFVVFDALGCHSRRTDRLEEVYRQVQIAHCVKLRGKKE